MPENSPELNLPDDIEGASVFYDMKVDNPIDTKNVGLAVDVLSILGIKFRDHTLSENFHVEFAKIHQDIFDSIQNPRTGYLVEIVVYVDSDGFITLPQGRLVNPIGIGVEPLDAMAKYLSMDQMVPGGIPPRSLKNASSFLWITKSSAGLSGRSIPNSFYDKFYNLSNNEAKKRKLMGRWIGLNDDSNLKVIQIAEFWSDQERRKKMSLEDDAARDRVEKLTAEMRLLQEKANEIYRQFQKTQEEMVSCQKLQNTLNAISAVAGLVRAGIELNEMVSSADQPIKNGSDSHMISLEETETINTSRLSQLGKINTQLTTKTKEYMDDMGHLHRELSIIYGVETEPVPAIDSNPLLLP